MTYNYTLETDDGDIALELEITHFTPFVKGRTNCSNDDACPDDYGDLEYEVVDAKPSVDNVLYDEDTDAWEYWCAITKRCLEFEPTKSEDKEIIEYLDKQLAEERESAHFDRECERMGI